MACIYLAGDSLAIYGLASLFNRHGRQGTVGSTLEVLWAPVLLIHLAGHEQITAYSIQDNELWRRHIVILVTQVAVALYVFIESWSRERSRRLLASAILLFIIGIYKMSTKPWALKRATLRNLFSSPASLARRKQLIGFGSGSSHWLLDTWKALTNTLWVRRKAFFFTAGDPTGSGPSEWRRAAAEQEEKEVADAELGVGEYVHKVVEAAREAKAGGTATLPLFLAEADTFAADILVPYSRRLKILEAMFKIDWKGGSSSSAFAVRMGLDEIYYRLYTRAKVASTPISLNLRLLTSSLSVVAIALFATSPKSHDDVVDVKVTYILFCFVALLEVLSLATVLLLDYPIVLPPASYNAKHMVYQQSLISSAARRRKPTLC
ncbi:unnamed protein product [Miscanthus lutarioriparius]|uniref:DUF4220 domain-containing protein n=1 Tax=Miscanthus lutarioriparius TaxID=422564 RepID=A0A811QBJ6_9POAL|nr:unnamed protein product [Miscanthus lutarioriparius]